MISVDDGPVLGLSVNFVEDFEFDNGYVSPYLVTDPGSMIAVLDDPYILLQRREDHRRPAADAGARAASCATRGRW